ncbi:MAG TPA: type II secretion system F family protein [Sedimentisphaerales bacterium]|nr:type II secretion system F family protein [Sedimentisphaerales bacterium]
MPVLESDFMNDVRREAAAARRQAHRPVSPARPGNDILRRAGTKDLCRIARQLSALLHAGMPLVPAMSALVEQLECPTNARSGSSSLRKKPLVQAIRQVRDDVNEGMSMAEALGRHPGVFSPLFVSMVSAGESSGALEEVLARIADILEKRVQLVGKVKAAITYPTVMATVAAAVVVFLISYVVPGITRLFTQMNHALPWPTRFLISVSEFSQTYLMVFLGLFCAAVIGLAALRRNREGKAWLDRIVLKLPLFGPLLFRLELARLTRTLGTLMKSGLPVMAAMEITQRVIQNSLIAEAMKTIRESVHKGDNIAGAMKTTGLFPPVVYHLIATGQMSGNIEDGMIDIAEMYDGEVEASVRTLTSLLEPVILLVMGGIVTFIVLAILLPIFEINQAL